LVSGLDLAQLLLLVKSGRPARLQHT
jgi:hypothetical protein